MKHDPYEAWRVKSFRFYMIGWMFTLLGTRIQSVAIAWEIYKRTNDAFLLGLVGLVQALPNMTLAIPAGFLADRFDRKKLTMLSIAGATITSIFLAWFSFANGSIILMYVLLFLDAVALSIGRPARSALVPQIVPRQMLPNAIMWNGSMFQFTNVVGPAIGGFIVAINVPIAYLICACGSLSFMISLTRVSIRPIEDQKNEPISFRSLIAGLRFVWRAKLLLTTISLDMFAVLLGGAVYLLPIFAEKILNVGSVGFGWLRAAPAIGAFLMAIVIAYLPPMKRAGRNLLLVVAGFGIVTIIFGISKSFWISFFMLAMTGMFDQVSVVIRHTLVQSLTPDRMRGRVSAVNSIFVGASNELGGFESGTIAAKFGEVISVVSGGIGTIIVVLIASIASPKLRSFGTLHDIEPIELDDEA